MVTRFVETAAHRCLGCRPTTTQITHFGSVDLNNEVNSRPRQSRFGLRGGYTGSRRSVPFQSFRLKLEAEACVARKKWQLSVGFDQFPARQDSPTIATKWSSGLRQVFGLLFSILPTLKADLQTLLHTWRSTNPKYEHKWFRLQTSTRNQRRS